VVVVGVGVAVVVAVAVDWRQPDGQAEEAQGRTETR
jgi:hypothetical protein